MGPMARPTHGVTVGFRAPEVFPDCPVDAAKAFGVTGAAEVAVSLPPGRKAPPFCGKPLSRIRSRIADNPNSTSLDNRAPARSTVRAEGAAVFLYIDATAGGVMIQVLLGGAAGIGLVGRLIWARITSRSMGSSEELADETAAGSGGDESVDRSP